FAHLLQLLGAPRAWRSADSVLSVVRQAVEVPEVAFHSVKDPSTTPWRFSGLFSNRSSVELLRIRGLIIQNRERNKDSRSPRRTTMGKNDGVPCGCIMR